jgi:hypothetical protein
LTNGEKIQTGTIQPKSAKHPFEIIRIAKKGQTLGIVHANDHDHARAVAMETFRIRRPETAKLIVRKLV